jgi:hypothetical protein
MPVSAPATLRFYNLLGQLVAETKALTGTDGQLTVERSVLDGASGLLFYRVESAGGRFSGKLLLMK